MKKVCLLLMACIGVLMTGCGNKDIGLGQYTYYYVTCDGPVKFQNEPIKSWKDFDGEQMEVTLSNGNTLLISSNYCVLTENEISDENIGGQNEN